ncbi:hypothetical protein [Jiangella gansuensis]|uniref:hypothetical protein n=1 Tax=Jiangella gansuensis TaxID=281473 RepID=UPI00047CE61B|nr:hypothetical protein [Jiangella gansuensis]
MSNLDGTLVGVVWPDDVRNAAAAEEAGFELAGISDRYHPWSPGEESEAPRRVRRSSRCPGDGPWQAGRARDERRA